MPTRYSLKSGPRDLLDLWRYHRAGTARFARDAVAAFREGAAELETLLGRSVEGMRMVEIGSGQRYQNVVLYHAAGAQITGIDLEDVGPGMGKYWRMLWNDGPLRAVKSLGRAILFDGAYFRELQKAYGAPLARRGLDLRVVDAARLPFGDASVDAVISTAVFEHIEDLDSTVAELKRVLKPGGVCRIAIHLFGSLSGGHHLPWQDPNPQSPPAIPAWDHLRENRYPAASYLNGLRKSDYLRAFEKHLQVEQARIRLDGEAWLTPQIEAECAAKGWTRDDLLETELMMIARAPGGKA